MAQSGLTGMVLRLEKSSVHDGAGLRTVVFLKGCPLRCLWCSTPESQHMKAELGIYGRSMSVGEVLAEVLKDEVFYFHSGGGLTVSGGEPLLQAAFVAELLRGCRSHGVNTALETAFAVTWAQAETVLPQVDTLFADIKHSDNERHRQLTGSGNEEIFANIRRADASPWPFTLILRMPLIPGVNDDTANLRRIAEFASSLARPVRLQLLPYHRLGSSTYAKLGREYPLPDVPVPDDAYIRQRYEELRQFAPGLTVI